MILTPPKEQKTSAVREINQIIDSKLQNGGRVKKSEIVEEAFQKHLGDKKRVEYVMQSRGDIHSERIYEKGSVGDAWWSKKSVTKSAAIDNTDGGKLEF